uniref:Uncharacterized protein n=1 Tax=Globodera rostochiensis TaxID=31243 RepID=A0A914GSA4_GLORO
MVRKKQDFSEQPRGGDYSSNYVAEIDTSEKGSSLPTKAVKKTVEKVQSSLKKRSKLMSEGQEHLIINIQSTKRVSKKGHNFGVKGKPKKISFTLQLMPQAIEERPGLTKEGVVSVLHSQQQDHPVLKYKDKFIINLIKVQCLKAKLRVNKARVVAKNKSHRK